MLTTEELIRRLDAQHEDIKTHNEAMRKKADEANQRHTETVARLTEVEQALASRRGAIAGEPETLGGLVTRSDGYKNFKANGFRGTARIPVDFKTVTTGAASGGALIAPDRQGQIVMMPRQRLTVRQLLAPGQTSSNLVQFTRQTGRTNAAAVVTEAAQKPESDITFELAEAPVRVIATWIPVSRQAMDDAPFLQSTIDSELKYMIDYAEEQEILFGDGTGEHINGLSTQVTPFNALFSVTSQTYLDTILLAIAQAQQSKIMSTGVIVNDLDWKRIQAIKDSQLRYIGGGPFAAIGNLVWSLPVVDTPAMPEGEFMVGAFAIAAQIIDRMVTEVLVSSEDRDNFIKNMLTVRAEERVALAVKIPEAIVFGNFTTAT